MKHSIKIFLRNLLRNKITSFVKISGFVISLSIAILLIAFLIAEYNYDKQYPEIEQIYRVKRSDNFGQVAEQTRDMIMNKYPEVQYASNYIIDREEINFGTQIFNGILVNTDKYFFDIFSIQFVKGNKRGIFNIEDQAVLTEKFAYQIFGDKDPMGKTLTLAHKKNVIVAGIIKNLPKNSSVKGDIFCKDELRIRYSGGNYNGVRINQYSLLLKLTNLYNVKSIENEITSFNQELFLKDNNKRKRTFSIQPLSEAYFDNTVRHDGLEHANIRLINLLKILTLILITMAAFNYINLSIAEISTRAKELRVSLTLGAGKYKIFFQFIVEAFYTIWISLVLSVIVLIVVKPFMESILGKGIEILSLINNVFFMICMLVTSLILAALSGLYPAMLSFKPNTSLLIRNKSFGLYNGYGFRKTMNVIQFAATIVLIVSLIAINKQIDYVRSKGTGFDHENIVLLPVHYKIEDKVPVLKEKLGQLSFVKSITSSHGFPGSIWSSSKDDEFGHVSHIITQTDFIETYGLNLIKGRNFRENESEHVCIINEKIMNTNGWDNFEGKTLFGGRVIGVIKDFHFNDMYQSIGGLSLIYGNDVSHISLRLKKGGNLVQQMKQIEKQFKAIVPDYLFDYQFYDTWIDSRYKEEEKKASSIKFLSVLAIIISCIGLFGLTELNSKLRIKEIGIRKVNGAKISEILSILHRDILTWILTASFVSIPISFYIMKKWLSGFAYQTNLSWWIFALSGFIILTIAIATVSWQTWQSARKNPVEALRYE